MDKYKIEPKEHKNIELGDKMGMNTLRESGMQTLRNNSPMMMRREYRLTTKRDVERSLESVEKTS